MSIGRDVANIYQPEDPQTLEKFWIIKLPPDKAIHTTNTSRSSSRIFTMSDCSSPASHSSSYSIFSGARTPETHLTSPSLSREGSPKVASTYEYTANTTIASDFADFSSFVPDTSSYPLDTTLPEDPNFFEFASVPLIPLDYFPEDPNAILEDPNFDLSFFSLDFSLPELPVLEEPLPEPQQPISSFWKAPPAPPSIETPVNCGYPPASAFYGPLPGTFSSPPKPDFSTREYHYQHWYSPDGVEVSPSVALHNLSAAKV